jgi:alpha-glucoside transport system permease protein
VERQVPELSEPASTRILRILGKTPVYLFLVFIGLLWLVPTIGLLFTSLLEPAEIGRTGWWHVITQPSLATLDNYNAIFHNHAITSAIWTTVWISLGATILPIVLASLAAYAFAWLEFPGRDWLFLVVVALLVVPIQMALIPIFSLYNDLGLFDTIPGLILFHTAFGLPFAIFLLRNFFIGIPRDLLEAARIDGASVFRIFVRLILPL